MALTAKKVYAILKRQISDMEAKLNSPVRYRGTVATADLLPLNPDIGDMYNIESKSVYGEAGMNVAWNGVVWDTMGAPIDMSLYFTKEEAEAVIQRLVTEYFEKNPVKPGATTEQAQQIEQNKTDIASLKVETGSLKEDKIDKPTEIPTAGEYIRVKSVNDGIPEFEWADKEETILDAIIKEETSAFSLEFNVPYKEVSVRIKTSKISSEMQPISIYPIINNNNGVFGYIHTRYKGTKEYHIYLTVKKIAQTIMTWISINTAGTPLNTETIPTGASEAINKITMNIGLPVGSEMIVKGVKL